MTELPARIMPIRTDLTLTERDWPVSGDLSANLNSRSTHPALARLSTGNLWDASGVARNDDNEPHYAVPLVGTTVERLDTVPTLQGRARHYGRVWDMIKSGRIY